MSKTSFVKPLLLTCGMSLFALGAPAAYADSAGDKDPGPKVYLGAGASAARLDNAKVADNDIATGDLSDFSDDRITGQVYGGVMFVPWFGVELGYIHLPEYSDNGFDIDDRGLSAAAILAMPVGDRAELYVKGGQVQWDIDVKGPLGFDAEIDGRDWLYGVGANFAVLCCPR